ncbi:Nitroreductase, partial [Athelia psychrophila]
MNNLINHIRGKSTKPKGNASKPLASQSEKQGPRQTVNLGGNSSAEFLKTVKARRTYYSLSNASPISNAEIRAIVESAVTHVPSSFNGQTSRAVLLTGKSHQKLWEIVKTGYIKSLGVKAPADIIKQSEDKIGGYAAGYGTVMFFEDQAGVERLAHQLRFVADHFPTWSENATGMLQFVVWTALEAEGLGASLQHHAAYADEIASGIRREFGLSETWKCTGLMPFGVPVGPPGQPGREKTFKLIGERVRVINDASVRSLKPSAPQPPHSPATSAPFLRTVKARRTYYGLSNTSPI